MRRKEAMILVACLVGLLAASVQAGMDPNSDEPGYVFTTVDANGWIDAGSSPDYHDLSYSFMNLKDSTHPAVWLTTGLNTNSSNYYGLNDAWIHFRFQAPEGKLIDELQLGLHGSTHAAGANYAVRVRAGAVDTAAYDSGGEFYLDAGAVLEPTPELEVWIQLVNRGDDNPGDETEIYETWLAPGNAYEFAVHVTDPPASDGLVEVAPDGSFNLQGPVGQFSDWAHNNFNADGLDTWTIGYAVTMPRVTDRTEAMSIVFELPEGREYETARLDYSSQVYGYGSNYGYVQLNVTTDEGTTKIYYHQSPDYAGQPESMNYDPLGGVPNTAGVPFYRVFTEISDLVAGKSVFVLEIIVRTGWSGHFYNGGVFLPGRGDQVDIGAGEGDFYFTGTTAAGSPPPEPDPCEFVIRGPVDDFVDWAKGFGATGDMLTFNFLSTWYSGGDNDGGYGQVVDISIPFEFPRPLVDARLDYGSILSGYGDNEGYCKIDVVTEPCTVTQIYYHQSPDVAGQPDSMNYTPDGGVPKTPGAHRVYTDIDALVSGETKFTLNITVGIGWSSWLYNGCQFLPSTWGLLGDSDFILSGHLEPGPSYCGDTNTYYLDSDTSGPAGVPDCRVDLHDLAPLSGEPVDLVELSLLGSEWITCTDPCDPGCIDPMEDMRDLYR